MAEWIVIEIDGKIASVAGDYRHLPRIAAEIAKLPPKKTGHISTRKISTEQLLELAARTRWEDLRLFGTKFQINVWKTLYGLEPRLYSYSEFAHMVDNPQGVRAVAHAVAANPVAYIIPCHLIIPKESMDKAREIRSLAEKTLFQGQDLYLLDTLDVGEYAYGPELKRELIKLQLRKP
ncbi:MAG: methylated-DNA--[protein]-cysteine S-methyltransferase [Bacteroidales bacterium]|nr:methylated-DNA--[protein]-cysteine S-methyltransferase [Bacteroidales bacterium]